MRALLAALLAAAAWTLAACAPAAPPAPAPAIWRISDADSEIWLFGSVHLLPPELDWRSAEVEAAFNGADEFVTETDTGPEAAASFAALAQRYGRLPADETLADRIGAAEAARLARLAAGLGIDPAALAAERPWLAALQLSYSYAVRAGQSPDHGVDTVLADDARRQGKRLTFFETPEQQIRVLADLPRDAEAHFLSLTMDQVEAGDDQMDVMDRAWVSGDTATLERLLAAEWRESGDAVHDALILRRNRAWAENIEQRLHGSGRAFITVGAAHLLGEGSVVALLRERGVRVEGP